MHPDLAYATDLIQRVCSLTDERDYLSDLRRTMQANGVARAVQRHDSAKLIEWLVEAVSFQGISDAQASRYMAEHGRVSIREVEAALDRGPSCPRLQGFDRFVGCGFAKNARTCAEPDHIGRCPLPQHDLRNGRLNQIAYALVLFVRDICDGDLVGWIDLQLAAADDPDADDPSLLMRAVLLEPLARVPGLSYKVLSMSLADLLLGAGGDRARWADAGSGMVAIDTLMHNWLARTGILNKLDGEHAYGPACYRPGMCADIIGTCAAHIGPRAFCPEGSQAFPRSVQHGLWRFCAESGYGICNGIRIDDRFGCDQQRCPLHLQCEKRAIIPSNYIAAS